MQPLMGCHALADEGGAVGTVLCISALAERQSGTVTGENGE